MTCSTFPQVCYFVRSGAIGAAGAEGAEGAEGAAGAAGAKHELSEMQAGVAAAACAAGAARTAGAAGAARAAGAAAGRFSQVPAGESQKSSPVAIIRADPTRTAMVVFFMTFLPDDRQLRSGRSRRGDYAKAAFKKAHAFSDALSSVRAKLSVAIYGSAVCNSSRDHATAIDLHSPNWADPQIVASAFHPFRTPGTYVRAWLRRPGE